MPYRKDDDGHKYDIPEQELWLFDKLINQLNNVKFMSDEYYDIHAEISNNFDQYMIG